MIEGSSNMRSWWLMLFLPTLVFAQSGARQVEVAEVLALDTAARTWSPGTILSRTDSEVGSEVAGVVSWIADPGTRVEVGDVIARIESDLFEIAVDDQSANVRALEERLVFLRSEAERLDSLAKVNSAARSQLEEALANRNVAEEEIVQARARLQRNTYLLEHSQIRAPFTGQIVERLVDPGEYVQVGFAVARLVDLADLEIRTQAPLRVAPFVAEGDQLPVRLEESTVSVRVTAVIPVGNLESRSFEVRLRWHGSGVIGTPVRVGLPIANTRAIKTVPRDAMVIRETGTAVYKIVDGVAERVEIETGIGAEDRIEVIAENLNVGDLVVVSGVEFLRTGQAVSF